MKYLAIVYSITIEILIICTICIKELWYTGKYHIKYNISVYYFSTLATSTNNLYNFVISEMFILL